MSVFNEIEAWFAEQPKWLQEAARLIIETGTISSEDEKYLMKILKMEATGALVIIKGIAPESISIVESESDFYLKAIQKVSGVNAIRQSQPLSFESHEMNVVYGDNGTGKTGYIRLLKKASASRFSEDILRNIYSKEKEVSQSCEIEIITNGKTETITCDLGGVNENTFLGRIDVFDSKAALAYLNDGLTTSYEPWIIGLLQRLVIISDRLRDLLLEENNALEIPNIEVTEEIQGSTKIRVLEEITHETKVDSFALLTLAEHEERIKKIEEQLSDSFSARRAVIERQKDDIKLFIQRCEMIHSWLIDSTASEINASFEKWEATHERKEEATRAFSAEHADITLSNSAWRAMWDAVEKYATTKAEYVGEFPYLGDNATCPFCEQPLHPIAKDRLRTVAEQVNSDFEQSERDALAEYREVLGKAPSYVSDSELTIIVESLVCFTDEEKRSLLQLWHDFCQFMIEAKKKPIRFVLPPFELYYARAVNAKENYESELKRIDESLEDEQRGKLIVELLELKGEVFLHKSIPLIARKISILIQKRQLEAAQKLVSTNKLSRKNKELATELVTNEYISRFNSELALLSTTGLKAELREQKAGKGRIPFKVTLVTQSEETVDNFQVLSEGEQRVVALAVFLADATGGVGSRPIVFDDPISSLDHKYEKKVAERLVNLSKTRQVIVFTHRLSLYAMIQNLTEELGINATAVSLSNYPTFIGNPSSDIGFILDPKKVLNRLKNDQISRLRQCEQVGSEEYREVALGICRQIRECVERCVEKYLFNGAVERFCCEIQTKRVRELKQLKSADFEFIDEYMTKYSSYVHAIADETPLQIPSSSDLEGDIDSILSWINEIKKRLKKS